MLDRFKMLTGDLLGGQNAGRIARMNSGFLDVLLNSCDDDCRLVRKGIDVDLAGTFKKFVDQDRFLR